MNHRNTVTQLFSYLNKIYAAEDNFDKFLTVYLDVMKTFDSVSIGLLLDKLSPFDYDRNLLVNVSSCLVSQKLVVKYYG